MTSLLIAVVFPERVVLNYWVKLKASSFLDSEDISRNYDFATNCQGFQLCFWTLLEMSRHYLKPALFVILAPSTFVLENTTLFLPDHCYSVITI
jgi:hypothetical protein